MSMQEKIAPQKAVTERSDVVWLHYSDRCKPDSQQCLCSLAVPFIQSLIWIDSGLLFFFFFVKWKHWGTRAQERTSRHIQATPRDTGKIESPAEITPFPKFYIFKKLYLCLMLLLRDVWSLLDNSIWLITVNSPLLFAWSACTAFTGPCWRKDMTVSLLNRISAGWLHHGAV